MFDGEKDVEKTEKSPIESDYSIDNLKTEELIEEDDSNGEDVENEDDSD